MHVASDTAVDIKNNPQEKAIIFIWEPSIVVQPRPPSSGSSINEWTLYPSMNTRRMSIIFGRVWEGPDRQRHGCCNVCLRRVPHALGRRRRRIFGRSAISRPSPRQILAPCVDDRAAGSQMIVTTIDRIDFPGTFPAKCNIHAKPSNEGTRAQSYNSY